MLLDLSKEHKKHLAVLLQVDSTVVTEFGQIHGVEGLTYLLAESSKLMISELHFQNSVFVLGFSEEFNRLLLQKQIRTILNELAPDLPNYHRSEWQLDVQLASRSLWQQIKPAVTFKLHLNYSGDHSTEVLQTDPATLLHLVQQLEQALEEMKTNQCRSHPHHQAVPVLRFQSLKSSVNW
uniref:COMM domain-containing protein n=1 Tax=Chinchilla lanigera TaxID=34839 RepID=A0A8C2YUK7_CHILA